MSRVALFHGCWERPGHYLFDANGRTVWRDRKPAGLPWDDGLMDTGLLQNGKIKDEETGRVYWTCGGRPEFWHAFYWWDRSGDKRSSSNSGFYVCGFTIEERTAAFQFACDTFPNIVSRQRFPLQLVERRGAPQETKP